MSGRILAAMGLFVFALTGCGSDEPPLYHLSGTVTFDGKPIPQGQIYFEPDGSKGNSGAAGFAVIEDGKFDTSAEGGKGHVSGPMTVRIEGQDPAATVVQDPNVTSGEEIVKPLFPPYETTADLPKEDSTQEFAVPAEAAKVKVQTGEAAISSGGV
jgi:hypothetical protein